MTVQNRAALKWWHGWPPLVIGPAAVILFAPANLPRWLLMWMLASAIYGGCKWLTWRRTPVDGVAGWRHAAYLLAWPGLDPAAFLCRRAEQGPSADEWARGSRNLLAGLVLFFGLARLVALRSLYVAGWIGMAGIVLSLHFGLFLLLSCFWRRAGLQARPLMDTPVASVSLGEFWGRRWNTAFRDLTHRFLFRPLTRRLGARAGLAGGFVFSGLVHELVISWPAGGGYGGPTLFFLVQGLGTLLERSRFGQGIGLGRGVTGRLFALLVLVAPAPWLFHPPFVNTIVVPFMHAMGAL